MLGGVTCKTPRAPSELDLERENFFFEVEALTARNFGAAADRLRRRGIAHLVNREREWDIWRTNTHDVIREDVEKPKPPDAVAVDLDGKSVKVSRWHHARASGLQRKFERIRKCKDNQDFLRLECRACGTRHHMPIGCGHRECPKCRHLHASRVKKFVTNGRRALRKEAKARHRDRTLRERLLTLTSPHYGPGEVREAVVKNWRTLDMPAAQRRIEALFSAWNVFRDWLRDYTLSRLPEGEGLEDMCQFFRVFEWTEGEDGEGHPHFHVYLHGPFLPRDEIQAAWARALETVTGEANDDVIIDIRAASDGGNVRDERGRKSSLVNELVKYMVKDFSQLNHGAFVNPVTMSAVLISMMNKRRRQTSAGFSEWSESFRVRVDEMPCTDCGTIGDLEHRHMPRSLVLTRCEERGPPGCDVPRFLRGIEAPRIVTPGPQLRFQL